MNCINIISIVVMALASTGIFLVAYSNYLLSKSSLNKSEKHEQEMRDLLQALVCAIMHQPHGGESYVSAMNKFKNAYKGKTKLFD